jgi:type II secretory pathway pseudopilin PulG
MNHKVGPHHKMWTSVSMISRTPKSLQPRISRPAEAGYTLVALLALMTVLALFALAAAPSIRQQAQREREIETIFRGEEVAEAIRLYYSYQLRNSRRGINALPTSIDNLREGVTVGTKKVQLLRASAARDPLSDSGEWTLIQPRSAPLSDFTRAVMLFAGNVRPTTTDLQLRDIEQDMAPPVLPTLGLSTSTSASNSSPTSTGPFIGVASASTNNSILTYYGIDRYDGWIFTPLFR